jgi:hypothetical protein
MKLVDHSLCVKLSYQNACSFLHTRLVHILREEPMIQRFLVDGS